MNIEEFKEKVLKLYISNKLSWHIKIRKEEHKDLLTYIEEHTPIQLKNNECSISTKIYCILNGLNDFPKCPKCGYIYNKVPILFKNHLCGDCSRKDKDRILKAQQTIESNGGYAKIAEKICKTRRIKEIENPNYGKDIAKKAKATKLKRYGNENYVNHDLAKRTCLKKYGVECVLQSKEIKERILKSNLEKWGVDNPSKSDEVKRRIKETHLKNHGVPYPMQDKKSIEKAKETKMERYGDPNFTNPDKCKQTKLERYGDPIWSNREQFKETFAEKTDKELNEIVKKIKKTKFERYGDENYCNIDKIKKTLLEHFGVDSPFKVEEIKERSVETYFERTGYTHPSKNPDVLEKRAKNYLAKTGYSFPAQNPKVRRLQQQKIFYNGINFGSSYELAYYIYLLDNNVSFEYQPIIALPYTYQGKVHVYHPDFKINNKLVEIKGDQFFKEDGTMKNPYDKRLNGLFEAKRQCMLQNGVKILSKDDLSDVFSYIEKTYGKNYLARFRKIKK